MNAKKVKAFRKVLVPMSGLGVEGDRAHRRRVRRARLKGETIPAKPVISDQELGSRIRRQS